MIFSIDFSSTLEVTYTLTPPLWVTAGREGGGNDIGKMMYTVGCHISEYRGQVGWGGSDSKDDTVGMYSYSRGCSCGWNTLLWVYYGKLYEKGDTVERKLEKNWLQEEEKKGIISNDTECEKI